MVNASEWLGIGLYTAAEAARLLDLPTAAVRRWLGGYRTAEREHGPIWIPQLPKLDGQLGLGFLDLVQLRVIARIVAETEISLQKLRHEVLPHAQQLLEHDHPFATTRFRTDGRRLFLEIGRTTDTPQLYDLLAKQYGFHKIIEPSFKDLDFEIEATHWWPRGRRHTVVLDPKRQFGAPIANSSGIPTATLALAFERHGSAREVARWYPSATEREVRDSVSFERSLARRPQRPPMAA